MLDSVPIVAITGQSLVESPRHGCSSRKSTSPASPLPITKHNFLVTRADDIAPRHPRGLPDRFRRKRSTRDLCLSTSPRRTRNRPPPYAATSTLRRARPRSPTPCRLASAANSAADPPRPPSPLITAAKKPVILAGHGVIYSGAGRQLLDFAERRHIPVASTLLGLGCFPTEHPLSLGMMGMHGEASGQQRHPGGRPAAGVRHAI